MNALLFGGNSFRNKDWVHRVGESFNSMFDKVVVHDYAHWSSGEPNIDFKTEQEKLKAEVQDLANYIIFAKSAGAVLSAKSIHDDIARPQKCIFVGTALAMVENGNYPFPDWLKSIKCPVLFIHNSGDPVASFEKLRVYLEAHGPSAYELAELPGDTHDYEDFESLSTLVNNFVFG